MTTDQHHQRGRRPLRNRASERRGVRTRQRPAGTVSLLVALGTMLGLLVPMSGTVGAASSASSGETTGITKTSVTLGQVDTLTGPVPGLFLGAKIGAQAYFDYVNSKGGINGRKLKLTADDDQFSPAKYTAYTKQLVNQTFALVGGFSLFDASGVPAINAAKIPDVTEAVSSSRIDDQYNYQPYPSVVGGGQLGPYKYYKKTSGSAYRSVGVMSANVEAGLATVNGLAAAMRSIGYKVTYYHAVSPLETQFISDVLRMKSQGVQTVFPGGLSNTTQFPDLAKEMVQQNYHPRLFLNTGSVYTPDLIPQTGVQALRGLQIAMGNAMYLGQDANRVPAVKTFLTWTKRVDPAAPTDLFALYGWTAAQLFAQALANAGSNPTRTSLFAALDRITNFNASGLLAASNPAQKKPATCWLNIGVVNGKFQRIAPSPETGYICNPGGYFYPKGYKFTRQPPPRD